MIEIHYSVVAAIVVAGWFISRILIYWKDRRIDFRYELKIAALFLCAAVILRFTFFPFDLMNEQVQPLILDKEAIYPFRINLIPLAHLFDYGGSMWDTLINIIGNTAMFIPVGVILPVTFRRAARFFPILLMGFLLSLLIEVVQLPFAARVSDVDDLILNTVGCAIGFACYRIVHKWRQK